MSLTVPLCLSPTRFAIRKPGSCLAGNGAGRLPDRRAGRHAGRSRSRSRRCRRTRRSGCCGAVFARGGRLEEVRLWEGLIALQCVLL